MPTASRSSVRRAILALLCLSTAIPLSAQPRPGALRFTVRDVTDLTIAGATVTLTASTGATRNMTANERGEALFDALAPGDYAAHIESPGFTPLDVKDLRVRAGSQTNRSVVFRSPVSRKRSMCCRPTKTRS